MIEKLSLALQSDILSAKQAPRDQPMKLTSK